MDEPFFRHTTPNWLNVKSSNVSNELSTSVVATALWIVECAAKSSSNHSTASSSPMGGTTFVAMAIPTTYPPDWIQRCPCVCTCEWLCLCARCHSGYCEGCLALVVVPTRQCMCVCVPPWESVWAMRSARCLHTVTPYRFDFPFRLCDSICIAFQSNALLAFGRMCAMYFFLLLFFAGEQWMNSPLVADQTNSISFWFRLLLHCDHHQMAIEFTHDFIRWSSAIFCGWAKGFACISTFKFHPFAFLDESSTIAWGVSYCIEAGWVSHALHFGCIRRIGQTHGRVFRYGLDGLAIYAFIEDKQVVVETARSPLFSLENGARCLGERWSDVWFLRVQIALTVFSIWGKTFHVLGSVLTSLINWIYDGEATMGEFLCFQIDRWQRFNGDWQQQVKGRIFIQLLEYLPKINFLLENSMKKSNWRSNWILRSKAFKTQSHITWERPHGNRSASCKLTITHQTFNIGQHRSLNNENVKTQFILTIYFRIFFCV